MLEASIRKVSRADQVIIMIVAPAGQVCLENSIRKWIKDVGHISHAPFPRLLSLSLLSTFKSDAISMPSNRINIPFSSSIHSFKFNFGELISVLAFEHLNSIQIYTYTIGNSTQLE